ncbi:glycosyltransferase [Thioalkalivibrio sp. ALJT]|uniref:glycosyltransferase family protein n=1 Tax=Thioalkalivibrio sp. ALJT TaxID=1158146 RepID=UPI00036BEEB0|nr:glycosyltransferase [Thioalkalivibrio sp. ALJT]
MDALLQHAQRLARKAAPRYRPIEGRVAYVIGEGLSHVSNDNTARSQGIAQALNEQGLETLCFVRPGWPWEEGASSGELQPEVVVDGVRYFHAPLPGRPATERTQLEAGVEALLEQFQVYRPQAVVAAGDWTLGLPAWVVAERLGLPFHNEVRDFPELSRDAEAPGHCDSTAFRIQAERDTFVAQKARQLFTLNQPMKRELVQRGAEPTRIHIVPHAVVCMPEPRPTATTLKHRLGITDQDRVIGYIGSGPSHDDLEILIEACEALIQQGQTLKLLLVGENAPPASAQPGGPSLLTPGQRLPDLPLWAIQTSRLPQEPLADYYTLLDAVVIPRKAVAAAQLVPPARVAEALAYGKRLVVSDVQPLLEYAAQHEGVVSFEAGSAESLAKTLQRSVHDPTPKPSNAPLFSMHLGPLVCALNGGSYASAAQLPADPVPQPADAPALIAPLKHPKPINLQPQDPAWFTFEVAEGQQLAISAEVEYHNIPDGQTRKAVLLMQAKDASGNPVDRALGKLAKSGHLNSHFMYLVPSVGKPCRQHQFTVPSGIARVSFGLCGFNLREGEEVVVRHLDIQELGIKEAEPVQATPGKIELTDIPHWGHFPVDELVPHRVTARLGFEQPESQHAKSAIVRVVYYDKDKQEIAPPYPGLPLSKTVGAFSYVCVEGERIVQLIPPRGAIEVALGLQRWSAKGNVWLEGSLTCESEIPPRETLARSVIYPSERPDEPVRKLSDIKVAAILDEFTMECFRMEVALTAISPENWEKELEETQPDFLFVESCWFGNSNTWSGLIYGYNSNGPNRMDELLKVVRYCRKKGIPTVFWSKEDPVHFSRFGPTAKLFDYVYTTDANMVPEYRRAFGIDAEPLCFFCQPQVHNPIPRIARKDKAAFAGSYYSDKIERCENFHAIMEGLENAGVDYDIYDRCLKRGVAHLEFPEHFKKHVVGYLEPHEMWKAYKGYRYTINLNTVKNSPTMFARRVYESLASGTPVISNYSEGVITQFGGIVCASDRQEDIVEYLERLSDPTVYAEVSAQGVRETLGRHTLADRLEQVCARVGIFVSPHLPRTNAVYTATTEQEVEQARHHFRAQTYHRKRLVVNLENSNVLYPYLNRNSDEEVFRVLTEFAKPLEGLEVPMSLAKQYPETHLEDAAIATLYEYNAPADLKEVAG